MQFSQNTLLIALAAIVTIVVLFALFFREGQQRTAEYWISKLDLQRLPQEGGFFRETYRSSEEISDECLPSRYNGSRNISTSIYYLMTPKEFSAFHRLQTDENWFHHDGETVDIFIIFPDGRLETRRIGPEVNKFSTTVPRGTWFAASVPKNFGLVSTTVAPGFTPADVEFATQQELLQQYPQYSELIARYTRE
jgi:hypothetical protein